jgi:hypothetical protein
LQLQLTKNNLDQAKPLQLTKNNLNPAKTLQLTKNNLDQAKPLQLTKIQSMPSEVAMVEANLKVITMAQETANLETTMVEVQVT